MEGAVITYRGLEGAASSEIEELLKVKTEQKDSIVVFDVKKEEDLCLLSYKAQSIQRVILLLDSFPLKDLANKIPKTDFSMIKGTFAVRCKHPLDDDIISSEIEGEVGNVIDAKVDLDDPDITIIAFIVNNQCYIGIDYSGEIAKRDYRLFTTAGALKATTASALLRFSKYKPDDVLLDPFSGSGTIPIEAALYATKRSPHFFSKDKFPFNKLKKIDLKDDIKEIKKPIIHGFDHLLKHTRSSQKNAKIAGVHKALSFSKVGIEWLDTKFEKNTVDKIITNPPQISRHSNNKEIEKAYKELFYQADFVLKKEGTITTINYHAELIQECAKKYKFKLLEEKKIFQGKQEMTVSLFGKS